MEDSSAEYRERYDGDRAEADPTSNDRSSGDTQRQRARYALRLQKACDTALVQVKNSNVVANSNWTAPLATAPSAVSIMAILLKAADQRAVAGLTIETQEVKDGEGVVRGKLSSKYFHTNLQNCADIGRQAFLDAQQGMTTIHKTAESMISGSGTIGYIIEMLEDPEEARQGLKGELEAVQKTAQKCLKAAESFTSKFEYWYLVITHLKQTSLSNKSEVIKKEEHTGILQKDAAIRKQKYEEEKEAVLADIQSNQRKLETAQRDLERAQVEFDRLRYEPILPEPNILAEIEMLKRAVPMTAAPTKKRGIVTNIHDYWAGQSDEHESEDRALLQKHLEQIQKLREEGLRKAQEQRNYQRKLAADRLQQAKEYEGQMSIALHAAYKQLSESKYQLADAKANLSRTKDEMGRLNDKKLELDDIMQILDESITNLGMLKDQIEPLVEFFRNIVGEVELNIEEHLGAFLRPITQGIKEGRTPGEIETIKLSRLSKQRMMAAALQMQGRFSAISDISKAYVTVSIDYIRPAIRQMESLARVPDEQWPAESQKFIDWCTQVIADIDGVAQETNANMEKNFRKHINDLQQRAIEAAEDRDDS